MDRKTKILMIVTVIVLVVLMALIGFNFYRTAKKEENNSMEQNTSINAIEENQIEESNELENNTTSETEENKVENSTILEESNLPVEKESNNEVVGREEQESNHTQEQTDEEKVIEIAKNKWGANDNSVYYVIEIREDDIYRVAVRSNITTEAKAWYSINIKTGEVVE